MEDLWEDADSGRLLIAALASGKPLAIVCHAPVAIMASRRKDESPFAGYRFTCYTNSEEDAVGLREKARWTVEDEKQVRSRRRRTRSISLRARATRRRKRHQIVDRPPFSPTGPETRGIARCSRIPARATP
jgi:putative intracellular protease/amidase